MCLCFSPFKRLLGKWMNFCSWVSTQVTIYLCCANDCPMNNKHIPHLQRRQRARTWRGRRSRTPWPKHTRGRRQRRWKPRAWQQFGISYLTAAGIGEWTERGFGWKFRGQTDLTRVKLPHTCWFINRDETNRVMRFVLFNIHVLVCSVSTLLTQRKSLYP